VPLAGGFSVLSTMLGAPRNSYAADMETMKSFTPQLNLVAPSPQSASLGKRCAGFTLNALKVCWAAYVQAAQYNAYWIGWQGAPLTKKDRA
jgi:hypothetical protein